MTLVSSTLVAFAVAVLVVAAIAAVLSIAAVSDLVVANHRARLARHESFFTYYRGSLLPH